MTTSAAEKLEKVIKIVQERAASLDSSPGAPKGSPSMSRGQRSRLRVAVRENYLALDELNHVFQDITSASSLGYFDEDDAVLIRQAASGLSNARRAIRRLASRRWVKK